MPSLLFAWRLTRSAWRAGEIRVLLAGLLLAVAAMSAVGFFADRMQAALVRQGGLLLGADLMLVADHPLPPAWKQQAHAAGLRTVEVLEFPSMALHGDAGRLAEVKAVGAGYPLRGRLAVSAAPYAPARTADAIPARGAAWVEPRLALELGLQVGDSVTLGERELRVSAILSQEPARGGDLFSIAPRLLMHIDDVPSTGLVQYGSRISYRLLVAGEAQPVARYGARMRASLARGERLEDVRGARPEVRTALDKTRRFLSLSAMASVVLAVVAMALAALRHTQRQLDACALMRCFGASQRFIVRAYLWQALLLGLAGSLAGGLLGYVGQEALARIAGSLFLEALPHPGWWPLLGSVAAGMAVLLAVLLPQLLSLRRVPALHILRRAPDALAGARGWAYLPTLLVLLALVYASARDVMLGSLVLAGLGALALLSCLVTWLGSRLLLRVAGRSGAWRLGLANLLQRPALAVAQVAGLGLGLMALLLLTLVRADLLESWQSSLPADAPNRFVINIQPQQLQDVQEFFAEAGLAVPGIHPMVRGRLVAINDEPLDPERYQDDRARRLASREFNLSWAAEPQADNRIVAGRWWRAEEHGQPWLSLEQGIAEALDIRLHDMLAYDIGGSRVEVRVQSLRTVEWDSMRANFFAVLPPGVLERYPASYITSIYLPPTQEAWLGRLVQRFPNLTVIDVEAILQQVRAIMDRIAQAVEFVFVFCLLSGFALVYAALVSNLEERRREAALLRVLGASRRQVLGCVLWEFAWIGLLAGVLAAVGASVLAWAVSTQVLGLAYAFNPLLALVAVLAGGILVPAAAWLGLHSVLRVSPRRILHNA